MKTVIDDQGFAWTRTSMCENCIEVSPRSGYVMIRDSNAPDQHIRVEVSEFQSFISGVKQGDFDKLG
jgi:CDP-diacylglycerol pyrophosphatase